MKLRADMFPYPVLNDDMDDYINSSFETEISTKKKTVSSIELRVKFNLNNSGLAQLISENKAKFTVHVEGVASSFRKFYSVNNSDDISIELTANEISERLEVNTMIVANEDINNYTNNNFNEDYYGNGFVVKKINRGDILAFDSMANISFSFENKEKPNARSMIRVARTSENWMSVDYQGSVIVINLPKKAYDTYHRYSTSKQDLQDVLFIAVVLPGLTYVLERISEENSGYDRDAEWAIALTDLLNRIGIDINDMKNRNALEVAQQLLDYPMKDKLRIELWEEETDED